MKTAIYEEVTARIVEQLEAGVAPWVKPWRSSGRGRQYPHNATTGRNYQGVNVFILAMMQAAAGYSRAGWGTYKQFQAAGGQVRKGEKASTIVYYESLTVKDRADPEQVKVIPMLKSFSVFNVEQADWQNGMPGESAVVTDTPPAPVSRPLCDAVIAATGATIRHGGDRAYYMPSGDCIQLPEVSAFRGADDYYGTAFHELTHWTSHASRLDRVLGARFGDPAYAFEELVAELGSAFLCARHGVDGHLQHAEYLGHWLKALKADSGAIFKAASLAQKAANFIAPDVDATEQPLPIAA